MGIRNIDLRLCNGCGVCIESCPQDVLRMNEGTKKAYVAYLRECESCLLCEMICPEFAIYCVSETPTTEAKPEAKGKP